jgi:YD repeat-containing protein
VTEIISDEQGIQQGYTTYFYSNFDDYPDLGPIFGFTNVAGDTGTRDSQAHKRGKLIRKEIHANDDRLAQSVDYYYKCMNADTVIALKTAEVPAVKNNIVTNLFGSFSVCNKYSVSNLLVEERRSDYALTPTMKSVDQCIKYKYNKYNQIIEKDVESSDENHLITRYKYPHDYIYVNSSDKNDICVKMFNKHIIAPVIEETQYRNSSLVEKTRSEYRFDNEIPYLYSSAKSYDPVSDNFQADVYNTKCDSRGNILCSKQANGLQTVYLWGYNYKYLVAIIENATLEEVETVLGETSENYAAQVSPDLSKIALLRKELKKSRITSYTYKPCVGVLTETDTAGHTIYYEYDTLGRLISASDENRNKVNAYKYHHRRITD